MKKMLIAIAIMALAVCALGYTQSMGTADGATIIGKTSVLVGDGIGTEAYVYAKFAMTGISFQIIDAPDCGVDESPTGSKDVWILTAIGSNADISQLVAPFNIENTGGIAIDLGMWVSDVSITSGDDWAYVTATEDIASASLNEFRLFGVFANGDWDPADEAAVDAEIAVDNAHWLPETITWFGATKYHPATGTQEVYLGKNNLNLAPACGSTGAISVVDYCQLRLRLEVGEGSSDMESHAAQITLVSRITEGT